MKRYKNEYMIDIKMLNEGLTDKIVFFTPNNMNKMWDEGLTDIIELFTPNNMNEGCLGKMIEIYASFSKNVWVNEQIEGTSHIFQQIQKERNLVIEGKLEKYYIFNEDQSGSRREGIDNCIIIETENGLTETIIYGQDFETFRKYKKANKHTDCNVVLEYMDMRELVFQFKE